MQHNCLTEDTGALTLLFLVKYYSFANPTLCLNYIVLADIVGIVE